MRLSTMHADWELLPSLESKMMMQGNKAWTLDGNCRSASPLSSGSELHVPLSLNCLDWSGRPPLDKMEDKKIHRASTTAPVNIAVIKYSFAPILGAL